MAGLDISMFDRLLSMGMEAGWSPERRRHPERHKPGTDGTACPLQCLCSSLTEGDPELKFEEFIYFLELGVECMYPIPPFY